MLRQSNLLPESDLARCRTIGASATSVERLADDLVRNGLLTPFHSTNLLRGRWRGFFLGKYRLLEQLGAGGMGQVFLATHQMMRRLVALKVLTLRPGADPSILPRFQREARAMAVLDHPNIVHAYDCDQDDKVHYIVLEYVDGISLSGLVKTRGPLPVERAVNYIYQAAQGLQHAHESGLVHRDIKPGNMLLDRLGVVKILDMGLARLFNDHSDNLTQDLNPGRALGTADYLAPEQVANSHDVDTRADIYSLGASLYFLLTGKALFQGATVAQKLILHQLKAPASLTKLRPEVPNDLEKVIMRMMAKQVEERYASAEDVCTALEPWAGPTEPPAELPLPCPAVMQMIQQYMPPPARTKSSGQIPRLPAAAPADISLASVAASPATATTSAGRKASTASVTRSVSGPPPLPLRRGERTVEMDRLEETPLAGSLYQSETEPLGRPVPPMPPPLSRATSEALFGNWMPDLDPRAAESQPRSRRWWGGFLIAGMLLVGGVCGIASNLFLHGSNSSEAGRKPRPLTPTEAANHLDQLRVVEMRVRSVTATRSAPAVIYLNSEADWKTQGNFTVLLNPPAVEQLKQEGIEDVATHFKDHKIRATGTIQLYKDRSAQKQNRVQMAIDDPASVQVVEP